MKKALNKISLLIFTILVFTNLVGVVNSLEFKKVEILEIYQIKTTEEVLVSTSSIIELYENNLINLDVTNDIKNKDTNEITGSELKDFSFQNEIVNFALQFIGNPYVMGGNSLINGTDCSGFVQLVFSNFDIYLPRTTYGQSIIGIEISMENIEIGDIISYGYKGNVTHSALYIGNETIIHASIPELGIRTDSMYIMPIITIRRVIN